MKTLLEDLSVFTNVPEPILGKLSDTFTLLITHRIYEELKKGNQCIEIELDYGTLLFKIESDSIRYKFSPSKDFEKSLVDIMTTGRNPIIEKLNSNLTDKLKKTYRELI